MSDRPEPHRIGRFGVRQLHRGVPTGGGTVNCGWDTAEDAAKANPPHGDSTYEVFERWGAP